jgi:fluoride exporter
LTLVLVLLGAAVGAPARWLLDQAVQSRWDRLLPVGTLTVNVLGSFVLGALLGLGARGSVGPSTVALVGTGFCGGFTTYSTFGYETLRLAEDGATRAAALNVGLSLALGLAAAFAGSLVVGG